LKFMAGERNGPVGHEVDETPARVSVGDVLRNERERRALSLDDVAANLRIRRGLLDAIEEGRFKELPGAPYAAGFIKAYAEFLELDRDEIIRRFKQEAAGLDNHKELNFPRPLSESRLPGGVLLLLSAVIAAGAYAVWYFQSSTDRTQLPRVAAVPERLAPLVEHAPASPQPEIQAAETASPRPADPSRSSEAAPAAASPDPTASTEPPASGPGAAATTSATPADAATAPLAPAASAPAAAAAPAVASAAPEATAIPAAPTEVSAQPRAFGESVPGRIVIRATADSWIQVRDPSGAVVFTRLLRTGDSYNVPNRQGLFLYTGSAGALEISVDGKIAPSLGQAGAVRRDVMLDPDRLAAGTAVLDQRRPSVSDAAARVDGANPGQASSAGGNEVSRQ
jgi:cytoskeleton protein RodZ